MKSTIVQHSTVYSGKKFVPVFWYTFHLSYSHHGYNINDDTNNNDTRILPHCVSCYKYYALFGFLNFITAQCHYYKKSEFAPAF